MMRFVLVVLLIFVGGCSLRKDNGSGWNRSVALAWDVHNDGGLGGEVAGTFANGWTYWIRVMPKGGP